MVNWYFLALFEEVVVSPDALDRYDTSFASNSTARLAVRLYDVTHEKSFCRIAQLSNGTCALSSLAKEENLFLCARERKSRQTFQFGRTLGVLGSQDSPSVFSEAEFPHANSPLTLICELLLIAPNNAVTVVGSVSHTIPSVSGVVRIPFKWRAPDSYVMGNTEVLFTVHNSVLELGGAAAHAFPSQHTGRSRNQKDTDEYAFLLNRRARTPESRSVTRCFRTEQRVAADTQAIFSSAALGKFNPNNPRPSSVQRVRSFTPTADVSSSADVKKKTKSNVRRVVANTDLHQRSTSASRARSNGLSTTTEKPPRPYPSTSSRMHATSTSRFGQSNPRPASAKSKSVSSAPRRSSTPPRSNSRNPTYSLDFDTSEFQNSSRAQMRTEKRNETLSRPLASSLDGFTTPRPRRVSSPSTSQRVRSPTTASVAATATPLTTSITAAALGAPRLRRTVMGLGYVHNAWPEPKVAELEKQQATLLEAERRRAELTHEIALATRKKIAQQKSKKLVSEKEAELSRMLQENQRRVSRALHQREAEIRHLEATLASIQRSSQGRISSSNPLNNKPRSMSTSRTTSNVTTEKGLPRYASPTSTSRVRSYGTVTPASTGSFRSSRIVEPTKQNPLRMSTSNPTSLPRYAQPIGQNLSRARPITPTIAPSRRPIVQRSSTGLNTSNADVAREASRQSVSRKKTRKVATRVSSKRRDINSTAPTQLENPTLDDARGSGYLVSDVATPRGDGYYASASEFASEVGLEDGELYIRDHSNSLPHRGDKVSNDVDTPSGPLPQWYKELMESESNESSEQDEEDQLAFSERMSKSAEWPSHCSPQTFQRTAHLTWSDARLRNMIDTINIPESEASDDELLNPADESLSHMEDDQVCDKAEIQYNYMIPSTNLPEKNNMNRSSRILAQFERNRRSQGSSSSSVQPQESQSTYSEDIYEMEPHSNILEPTRSDSPELLPIQSLPAQEQNRMLSSSATPLHPPKQGESDDETIDMHCALHSASCRPPALIHSVCDAELGISNSPQVTSSNIIGFSIPERNNTHDKRKQLSATVNPRFSSNEHLSATMPDFSRSAMIRSQLLRNHKYSNSHPSPDQTSSLRIETSCSPPTQPVIFPDYAHEDFTTAPSAPSDGDTGDPGRHNKQGGDEMDNDSLSPSFADASSLSDDNDLEESSSDSDFLAAATQTLSSSEDSTEDNGVHNGALRDIECSPASGFFLHLQRKAAEDLAF